LATDARSTVGVRMSDTNQIGVLAGTGDSMAAAQDLKLTLFSATGTLSPGQTVVTFGSVGGRPYVPGVPVGQVTTVTSQPGSLTQTAMVRPFADFTGLGVAGVVASRCPRPGRSCGRWPSRLPSSSPYSASSWW